MGKYDKGILGYFSEKIGPVVGSNWKSIHYMRSYTSKIKNPRTQPQMMQRTKFSIINKFIKPFRGILNIGWRLHANGMSPSNAAVRYLIGNAITGAYPDYAIIPEKVLISSGSLTPAINASAVASPGRITFNWDDNSNVASAAVTDFALITVIDPEKNEAIYQDNTAKRIDATTNIVTPAHWAGDAVVCYIGFISCFKDHVADSVYLGEIIAL